ncbi:MAG: hypothetical protein ACUVRV_10870 [Cyanobacteriota bacterium]
MEAHGRLPQHGEDWDAFGCIYAVRLDHLRASEECRAILKPFDFRGLLDGTRVNEERSEVAEAMDDEALLAALGVDVNYGNDVTQFTHVRSHSFAAGKSPQEIRVAEEIAQRIPCQDFEQFKPIFDSYNTS